MADDENQPEPAADITEDAPIEDYLPPDDVAPGPEPELEPEQAPPVPEPEPEPEAEAPNNVQEDTPPPPDTKKEPPKPPKKDETKKAKPRTESVKPLFDSKGSLLERESFVYEKLEEYKKKRADVGKMINDLQAKVKEYKDKKDPSDEDVAKLKEYHAAFLEKLGEFEEMTRHVERLMGMADVSSSQLDRTMSGPPIARPASPVQPPVSEKSPSKQLAEIEEKLPKLIVCGTDMGDSVPRIIVCEPLKKSDLEPFSKSSPVTESLPDGTVRNKMNEFYENQQKLNEENAQMANVRHQLQEELLDKQEMLECLQQKLMQMECEKYRLCNDNCELQKKLLLAEQRAGGPPMCKRELFMKFRGASPDMEQPLASPPTGCCKDGNKQELEQELEKMDGDIKSLFNEFESMQREKVSLGYSTTSPYATSPRKPVCKLMLPQKSTQTEEDKEKDMFFLSDQDPKYKDLREQYQRLHSDFKNKVTEVAGLRVDLEKTRKDLDDITIMHHELEAMHQKELDQNLMLMSEKNMIQSYKEQILDLESQASVIKQMYKSGMEEMEELRALVEDQAGQLDEYRNKYMKTLQIAEELKRDNEFKERECADQIAVQIQRVKLDMQEQLEELSPIKDLLKITQQKLKETEQMHSIALETVAQLSQKLEDAQQQVDSMKQKVEASDNNEDLLTNLQHSLEEAEKRMTEIETENSHLKGVVAELEGVQAANTQKLEAKAHENLQLITQLETLREESARQVARVKDRSGLIQKCLQAQIAEMEREVAQCRAAASYANRERDEIRQKLQMEVCLLSENFRESQNRIVQLQQHVNYLSASHPTSLIDLCQ